MFDERISKCPMCLCEDIRRYDRDFTGKSIDRCPHCGVMFLNPQYSDSYLQEYYSSYVNPEDADSGETESDKQRWRCLIHDYYLSLVEERIEPGNFLSVGCGDGLELAIAKKRGWRVEGFDVDPKVTEAVARSLGVPVASGDFRDAAYQLSSFDCVYLDQVLEHPKNPQDYLRKIHEILRPGGVIFIACPNIASLSNRLKTAAGKLGLKRRRGRHYDTWHHIFYYSPTSLTRVLEKHCGFRVVQTGCGFGDKTRYLSEARILKEIRHNRPSTLWKDVFTLVAVKDQR